MKFTKFLFSGIASLALALSLAACGNDDPTPEEGGGGGATDGETPDVVTPDLSDEGTPLTDDEAKEYLESVATVAMNKVKIEDHRPTLEFASKFVDAYGDFDFEGLDFDDDDDEEWEDIYDRSHWKAPSKKAMLNIFKDLRSALATGNYAALSRAAEDVLSLGAFTGIYEPDTNNEIFRRVGNSNDLIVKFYIDGAACQLTVTPGSDTWSYYDREEEVTVMIPRTLVANITRGKQTMASARVESNFVDGSVVTIKASASVANIQASTSTNVTNSTATTENAVFIDGEQFLLANGTVSGKGLATLSTYEQLMRLETEKWDDGWGNSYYDEWYEFDSTKLPNIFTGATATTYLMGNSIVVDAAVTDVKRLAQYDELEFWSIDYNDSKAAAKAACQGACDAFNQDTTTKIHLKGNSATSATLVWEPAFYGESYYYMNDERWVPEPKIAFSDGTTYSAEEYGKMAFTGVQSQFHSLFGAYKSIINALF